jgi:hypothetical protein
LNDEIRSLPENKVAAAVGVEIACDERQVPRGFKEGIQGAAGDTEIPVVD